MILDPIMQRSPKPSPSPGRKGILVAPADPGSPVLNRTNATDLLIDAIIQIESQGNPNMVGGIGERGLMQIRESTWNQVTLKHFGETIDFDRAFEPELNRLVGRYYLGDLQKMLYTHQDAWKADLRSLLLASYNAGPERVRRSGYSLSRLPKKVQSYALRGSALHDWYLEEQATAMHQMLLEAGKSE